MKLLSFHVFFLLILILPDLEAQTGIYASEFSTCETNIQNFMTSWDIPGLSIAIAKDGKLIYHRGFGTADTAEMNSVYPYHLFRIASVSKPVTSIGIMKLFEEGKLSMTDKVFGPSGILKDHALLTAATIVDNRIYDITVQNLLEHSAGWNRSLNCFPNPTTPYPWMFNGCDPIIAPLHVSNSNGTTNPVNEEDMIYFLLEKGLDFDPGTQYAYSNIGFLVLGEIIETLSGKSYEAYFKSEILEPIGAYDMHLGKNLLSDKMEREVEYVGNGYTTLDCYGNGTYVPWEYGGFSLEAMSAHGGWIASTRDLMRLWTVIDKFNTVPDILSASTIDSMIKPSANASYYAKGWNVNTADNWWHTGGLDGTATVAVRTSGGFVWAVFCNKRNLSSGFYSALDGLPWSCIGATSTYPAYDLFATPTEPSNSIYFTQLNNSSCQIQWDSGNGNRRIVVAKEGSPVDGFPVDGSSYIAATNFGSGSEIGDGNFVVYDGTGNQTTVNNLMDGKSYYFRVFEYNENATTGNHKLYLLPMSHSFVYQSGCHTTLNLTEVHQDISMASMSIVSNAPLPDLDVQFQAGQSIQLEHGFLSGTGFVFEAIILNCN